VPRGGLLRKIQAAQEVPGARIGPQVKQAGRVASLVPVNRLISVEVGHWSLTSLQQCLVKTGGRLVKHAHYYWLVLAEGHLTRQRFGSMLRRIAALPLPDG